jgi:hypothetical protein
LLGGAIGVLAFSVLFAACGTIVWDVFTCRASLDERGWRETHSPALVPCIWVDGSSEACGKRYAFASRRALLFVRSAPGAVDYGGHTRGEAMTLGCGCACACAYAIAGEGTGDSGVDSEVAGVLQVRRFMRNTAQHLYASRWLAARNPSTSSMLNGSIKRARTNPKSGAFTRVSVTRRWRRASTHTTCSLRRWTHRHGLSVKAHSAQRACLVGTQAAVARGRRRLAPARNTFRPAMGGHYLSNSFPECTYT